YGGTGHLAGVNEGGRAEDTGRKGRLDLPQVFANRSDPRGIVGVALQLDTPTVGERVEQVCRRVLVDSHRLFPPGLEGGELSLVGGHGVGVAAPPARNQGEGERGNDDG